MKISVQDDKLIGDGRKTAHAVRFSVLVKDDDGNPHLKSKGWRIIGGLIHPPSIRMARGGYVLVDEPSDELRYVITMACKATFEEKYPEVKFPKPDDSPEASQEQQEEEDDND